MSSQSAEPSIDPAELPAASITQIRGNVTSESIKIRREDLQEMASRLRREEADARFKRWKDIALFVVALLTTAAILATCLWILMNPNLGPDTREWARSITTLIIGGFVGYLTGRALK